MVFATLLDRKNALVAADILNDKAVPFFEEHSIPLLRILTDRGGRNTVVLVVITNQLATTASKGKINADEWQLRTIPHRTLLIKLINQEKSLDKNDYLG